MAEARRSGLKPGVKRLVCPCGAPVVVEHASPALDDDARFDDGPVQPKVMACPSCGRLLVADDPNVGRVVQGKWRLVRRLGQGGMGTVYLALETSVGREVALKFLHRHLAEREEYRTRFEQEARIMARVDHPNLAHLLSVERDGSVPFLVMKYVNGRPLSRLMKEQPVRSLAETLPLVVQMAAALSGLHQHGYVHRDLKPGNVMVADDGHVTLLDFGLTRTHDPNLTRPGIALGSPQYMSPEQVLAGSLDGRSDLYALGLLTSELLVGRRPFPEDDTKVMLLQHLNEAPEPPHLANAQVPEAVSRVLLKALSKKAADRQPTVEAFVEELVTAAKVGTVQLPQRASAEAMLANVSRPPPEPMDAEVAEVVAPETMSGPVPARKKLRPAPVAEARPSASRSAAPSAASGARTSHPTASADAPELRAGVGARTSHPTASADAPEVRGAAGARTSHPTASADAPRSPDAPASAPPGGRSRSPHATASGDAQEAAQAGARPRTPHPVAPGEAREGASSAARARALPSTASRDAPEVASDAKVTGQDNPVVSLPPPSRAPTLENQPAVELRTERVPAWNDQTDAMPAWTEPEAPPAAARLAERQTAPLPEPQAEALSWPLVLSLVGLAVVIVWAAVVLLA